MKITLLVTSLFGLVFLTTVSATEKTLTPQQQRVTSCNQQATAQALKGGTRKTYVSDCLKNSRSVPGEKSLTPQQQGMRECNNQTMQQSPKGDDRNKFMGTCLKKAIRYLMVLMGELRKRLTRDFILLPLTPSL